MATARLRLVSVGPVHLAHAAYADQGGDVVRAEAGTGGEGHRDYCGLYGRAVANEEVSPE